MFGIVDSNIKLLSNNLTFWIDASQIRSYPGTGTTWTDLTANANTGTLTNGPTFDSGNGGSIIFDGTNDYVVFNNVPAGANSTTQFSVSMWAYIDDVSNGNGIMCRPGGAGFYYTTGKGMGIFVGNYNAAGTTANNILTTGVWAHYVAVYDQNNTPRGRIYINTTKYTINISNFQTGNGSPITLRIAETRLFNAYGDIRVSQVAYYTSVLTDDEVTQIYNADKSRYGL